VEGGDLLLSPFQAKMMVSSGQGFLKDFLLTLGDIFSYHSIVL